MRYKIDNARTGQIIAANATLAANPLSRMRGLLGKSSLPPGEAIILQPASSIHTLFMRFPLDVIYLDRDRKVVKLVRDLAPFRFSAARGAHAVIEMAAGATSDVDLLPGDALRLDPLERA